MKKGNVKWDTESMCVGDEKSVVSLKQGSRYNFLGIMENIKQDDTLV